MLILCVLTVSVMKKVDNRSKEVAPMGKTCEHIVTIYAAVLYYIHLHHCITSPFIHCMHINLAICIHQQRICECILKVDPLVQSAF